MMVVSAKPTKVSEVARARDRISFLYVERAVVGRDENAITVTDYRGVVHVPAATIATLLLGPGTDVSHQAIVLLADSGSCVVWVGEQGVRCYGHGRALNRGAQLLLAQARLASHRDERLAVARRMYQMRFDEDVSALNMRQLRCREGARVRSLYRRHAAETGVEWTGRQFDPGDFKGGNAVNQALSAATACLYGVVHAVIVALGCSPGLGFVHQGNERSFVFDMADLYKMDLAVPVAFRTVASAPDDIPGATRRAMRDAIHDSQLIVRCTKDLHTLLKVEDDAEEDVAQLLELWDDEGSPVLGGVNYAVAGP